MIMASISTASPGKKYENHSDRTSGSEKQCNIGVFKEPRPRKARRSSERLKTTGQYSAHYNK